MLRCAARVIARRGFDRARFSDVAAEAGLAVSTLQYMFGSREDLLVAALELANDEELERLHAVIDEVDDPLERMHALIDDSVGDSQESWQLWIDFWRAAARDPQLNQTSRTVQERWHETLAQVVDDGVRSGVFREDLDPVDTPVLVLGVIDGVALGRIMWDPTADFVEAKRLVRMGVDRLLIDG